MPAEKRLRIVSCRPNEIVQMACLTLLVKRKKAEGFIRVKAVVDIVMIFAFHTFYRLLCYSLKLDVYVSNLLTTKSFDHQYYTLYTIPMEVHVKWTNLAQIARFWYKTHDFSDFHHV